jgi:hypothetical protein
MIKHKHKTSATSKFGSGGFRNVSFHSVPIAIEDRLRVFRNIITNAKNGIIKLNNIQKWKK